MSAIGVRGPRIRAMSRRQMEFVLARNHLARIAFINDTRIGLQPVYYVFADGMIYGRTSFGTKHGAWLEHPEVVLEVDESEGLLDWRSVVVRGKVSLLRARGPSAESHAYQTAVAAIQTLLPDAFTDQDPTPQRIAVFCIEPGQYTGREAISR